MGCASAWGDIATFAAPQRSWRDALGDDRSMQRISDVPLSRDQVLPDASMARLEALARLMDGIVTIPGTNIRMDWTASLAWSRWPVTSCQV